MKRLFSLLTFSAAGITAVSGSSNLVASQQTATLMIQARTDISDIKVKDQYTLVDINATYGSLNKKPAIIIAVINAIYKAKQIYVYADDFIITNDQDPNALQVLGTKVIFTVTASVSSSRVIGSFTFIDSLSKNDISDVIVEDLKTTIIPNETYGDLNNDKNILDAIIKAIDKAKRIEISKDDFSLTNDQVATEHQRGDTKVEFTITANEESDLIQGSFSFTDTLIKANISSVIVKNLQTPVDVNQSFESLNTNQDVINSVVSTINDQLLANITADDINLTNDQSGGQIPGTIVTFTVTASDTSEQIMGMFKFIDTLGKVDISTIQIKDLQTLANIDQTYGELNSNVELVNAIINGIYNAKGIVVKDSDIKIINDQDPNALQTGGTVVTFTVAATNESDQVIGHFTFIDTLSNGKVDISKGVRISDLQTIPDVTRDYNELNTNQDIIDSIINAINAAKSIVATQEDFTLTNDQSGKQAPGQIVTFTVTSIPESLRISGSFTFIDTLARIDISNGVDVGDLKIVADGNATYADLNNNTDLINAITNAIYNAKGVAIRDNDIIITNDQDLNAKQTAGQIVKITVTANDISSQIIGKFSFTITLIS